MSEAQTNSAQDNPRSPSSPDSSTNKTRGVEGSNNGTPVTTTNSSNDAYEALLAKFSKWKEKAKEGVNELRKEVMTLRSQLVSVEKEKHEIEREVEVLKLAVAHAKEELNKKESEKSVLSLTFECTNLWAEYASKMQDICAEFHSDLTADLLDRCRMMTYENAETAKRLQSELSSSRQQFDKFKKLSEQTLKISAKDIDDLKIQLRGTQEELEMTSEALSESKKGILQRDLTIDSLERQMEEATTALQSLHEQLERYQEDAIASSAAGGGGGVWRSSSEIGMPSAGSGGVSASGWGISPRERNSGGERKATDDVFYSEEKVREVLEREKQEWQNTHEAEITQLVASHELELEQLHTEYGNLKRYCVKCRSTCDGGHTSSTGIADCDQPFLSQEKNVNANKNATAVQGDTDLAYQELLDELTRTQEQLHAIEKEKKALEEALAEGGQQRGEDRHTSTDDSSGIYAVGTGSSTATGRGGNHRGTGSSTRTPGGPGGGEGGSTSRSTVESQADHRVKELEHRLRVQSEQLWQVNQQLLELKANTKSHAGQTHQQTRQQQDYLRSVCVRLLTEHREEVRASMVPILSTLLQFETGDLQAIYSANPDWAKQ